MGTNKCPRIYVGGTRKTKPSRRDCRKSLILLAGLGASPAGSGSRTAGRRLQNGRYDEPFGSGADVVRRIAGHEREPRVLRRIGHGNVVGSDDRLTDHDIVVFPAAMTDINVISPVELVKVAEESIPVSGNHGIPGFTWPNRIFQVARSEHQRFVSRAFQNGSLQLDLGNREQ